MFRRCLVLSCCIYFSHANIPDFIHICKRNDPQISSCIKGSIEKLRSKFSSGIPELGLPTLEPLTLGNVTLQQLSRAAITNLEIYDATNFEIEQLKANIGKNKFNFLVKFPRIHIRGRYDIDMNISFLRLKGNGPLTGNLTDVRAKGYIKGNVIGENGAKQLHFNKLILHLVPGPSEVHLEDLFAGDKLLGQTANQLLNENPDLFLSDVFPSLEAPLINTFMELANKITLAYTYDELFPIS